MRYNLNHVKSAVKVTMHRDIRDEAFNVEKPSLVAVSVRDA